MEPVLVVVVVEVEVVHSRPAWVEEKLLVLRMPAFANATPTTSSWSAAICTRSDSTRRASSDWEWAVAQVP
jgi:hypothetical protein